MARHVCTVYSKRDTSHITYGTSCLHGIFPARHDSYYLWHVMFARYIPSETRLILPMAHHVCTVYSQRDMTHITYGTSCLHGIFQARHVSYYLWHIMFARYIPSETRLILPMVHHASSQRDMTHITYGTSCLHGIFQARHVSYYLWHIVFARYIPSETRLILPMVHHASSQRDMTHITYGTSCLHGIFQARHVSYYLWYIMHLPSET